MDMKNAGASTALLFAERALHRGETLDYERLAGAIEQYPEGRHICGLLNGTEKKRPGRKRGLSDLDIHEVSIGYDIWLDWLAKSADRSWMAEPARVSVEGLTNSEAAAFLASREYGPYVSPKHILNLISKQRSRFSWRIDVSENDADDAQT
jgi:hypothetical protein